MKLKKYITLENLLCMFIILSPILDMSSYWFKRVFNTEYSISTILRPIIPAIVTISLFIKAKKKEKKLYILMFIVYASYAILHLIVSKKMFMGCSYGTINNEKQYVLNFTFLIVYLVMYMRVFSRVSDDGKIDNLKKSIVTSMIIYVISVIIAIGTNTSEYTYIETSVGYKGWYAQGNSLSAVLIMSLFILFSNINKTKWKKTYILTIIITSIYLILIVGTRAGMIGAALAMAIYFFLQIVFSRSKKIIIGGIVITLCIGIVLSIFTSNTIRRRKQVQEAKNSIIDKSTGEVGTMTGDMLDLKNDILANNVKESYMTEAQQKSVLDLYEYSQKKHFAGNDTRRQQLMYNIFLVKNQKNAITFLLGNGYKSNVGEMVMENELASMLLNFGLIGFILYVGPFITLIVYSIIIGLKNRKKIDASYVMLQAGLAIGLILSWFSGYVLFSMSCMVVMAVISTLLYRKIIFINSKKGALNEKNPVWNH